MPHVSIVLTSYNHEKYLQEAIDSALNQTFTDFELIIIDDASIDNSWNLIKNYSDPRIKPFRHSSNKGTTHSLNEAISTIASGKYIAVHHSDDFWESNKLAIQLAFLEAHANVGAVFSNALAVNENGITLPNKNHFYFDIFDQPNRTRHEWLRFFFHHGNALCHPSVLIRMECFNKCGLYRNDLAQLPDLEMWIRLCFKYDIHVIPEKLVKFRVRDNEANTSSSRPDTRIRTTYEFYRLLPTYRQLTCFEDLAKVFPEADKYHRGIETDTAFALAMATLESKPFPFTQLFAQDLLFEILSDQSRAKKIRHLYNFSHNELIELTGFNDVFSVEAINRIYMSRSWKITKPIRFLGRLFCHIK